VLFWKAVPNGLSGHLGQMHIQSRRRKALFLKENLILGGHITVLTTAEMSAFPRA
jgi:hypothetical protein